ncbi:MAG: DUF1638 domain-containing protein [Bacillota bacterium]|nr:DUF1638 domain-containing protein [Bacillota bacterium]
MESGLHNYPDQLKTRLQQTLDQIDNSDYILMLFGLCGNALLGLRSPKATLVIPKVDDCISLFLGGNHKRREMENTTRAYYLTKGWLRYENNIWQEYQRSIQIYGLEKTRRLFGVMLKHYTHLMIIDTNAYDTCKFLEECRNIATALDLEVQVVPGDLTILQKALLRKWDDDFTIISPGREVTLRDMDTCKNLLGDGASCRVS